MNNFKISRRGRTSPYLQQPIHHAFQPIDICKPVASHLERSLLANLDFTASKESVSLPRPAHGYETSNGTEVDKI